MWGYILCGIIAFIFFSFRTMSKKEFKESYKPLLCDIILDDSGNTVVIANFLGGTVLALLVPLCFPIGIFYFMYLMQK